MAHVHNKQRQNAAGAWMWRPLETFEPHNIEAFEMTCEKRRSCSQRAGANAHHESAASAIREA
jgi:hypothetical protein